MLFAIPVWTQFGHLITNLSQKKKPLPTFGNQMPNEKF